MLYYYNLCRSILSGTCSKRTILEQTTLLKGLSNVGVTYVVMWYV